MQPCEQQKKRSRMIGSINKILGNRLMEIKEGQEFTVKINDHYESREESHKTPVFLTGNTAEQQSQCTERDDSLNELTPNKRQKSLQVSTQNLVSNQAHFLSGPTMSNKCKAAPEDSCSNG